MKIINMTQHKATSEQVAAGVIDLEEYARTLLTKQLTFDDIPSVGEISSRASYIADMAAMYCSDECCKHAMIGGAPFFMSTLESKLMLIGITPIYAFSKRESKEMTEPDGSVRKINVFRHLGFVGEI